MCCFSGQSSTYNVIVIAPPLGLTSLLFHEYSTEGSWYSFSLSVASYFVICRFHHHFRVEEKSVLHLDELIWILSEVKPYSKVMNKLTLWMSEITLSVLVWNLDV